MMPKKGHTEEQIEAVLRQVEAGERWQTFAARWGISQATYYMWKRQYPGFGVSELRCSRKSRLGQSVRARARPIDCRGVWRI